MNKKCYNCGEIACAFYADKEEAVKCYMCRDCGRVWRDFDGFIPDIDSIKDEVDMLDVLTLDSFEAYTEAVVKRRMLDCVFKCEKCNSIAFEMAVGYYKCSNKFCGHEWEELY